MRASRALLGALAAAQVGYSRLRPERRVAATRGIVALMTATSAVEAWEVRGRKGPLGLAAAAGVGLASEHLGIRTGVPFGRYAYSDRLGPRVGGVPLLAGAAWAMMARPAWVVAGSIDERPAARVLLAAGALTAWDVFLDPRMARDGYWEWPGGGRYEGVPLSNFAGWFLTGIAAFSLLERLEEPGGDGDVALALYAWTWVGETVANLVVWRRPTVALAGSLAMGVFAVPALRARLRA